MSWEQADRLAIRTDSGDAEAWHAGHVNDVLPLADGGLLLASDSGGVWHLRRATSTRSAFARPYSDDWDNPDLMCLASTGGGIVLAGCQSSAGTTERLYETRDSLDADAVVSPTWRPVNAPANVGTIYRIAIASVMDRLRVLLAADGGLFWSNITVEGLPYVWTQVSSQACSGVAFGPGGSVVASTLSGGQIVRFAWSGPANAATLAPQAVDLPRRWKARMPRLGRTSLAACGGDPRHLYCVAAFNDPKKNNSDTFIRALARSTDGGAQWTFLDAKCAGSTLYSSDMTGDQGGYDNCIAVSPKDPDTVVIGWVSLFISTDGGESFDRYQGGTRLHADVHGVSFDPAHPTHLYVGSDGGVARTTDLGRSFFASYNKQLRNLQFASAPEREFYGKSTASPVVSGLIAGGLQDNGVVYGMPRVTPWKRVQGGDGGLGMFISPGQLISAYACCPGGPTGISSSRSALVLNDPSTIPIRGRGNSRDDNGLLDPAAARLESGSQLTRAGQHLFAVGGNGQPQQMLYGLFADADGGHAAWRRLAALTGSPPPAIWSVASAHGTTVFVGTATGTDKNGNVTPAGVYRVDDGRGPATQLPALPTFSGGSSDPGGFVTAIALRSSLSPLIAYNTNSQGVVFRVKGRGASASWAAATGLPGTQVFALAIDLLGDVYAATDDQVFLSRDGGQSFTPASAGLPRRPHCSHLFFSHRHGGLTLYLSTFGRSIWRAHWTTKLREGSGVAFGRVVGARDGGGFFLAAPQGLQAITPGEAPAAQFRAIFNALVRTVPALTAELQKVEDSLPETTTGWAARMRLHDAVGAVELAVATLVHIADDLPLRAGGTAVGRRLKRATALLSDASGNLSGLTARPSTLDQALAAAASQDRASLRQLIVELTLDIRALDRLETEIAS